jgi:hypothetical protein
MSKLLAGIIAALFVGVGVAAASSLTSRDDSPTPINSVSTLDSTASTGTTERTGTTETGEDVSGPCDEAEHANDPRCTGGALDDDRGGNSGSGRSGADDGDDDHGGRGHGGGDDDRSGSNSGRG